MYQKYATDALVLGSRERGEADRVFVLYTRDFGLIQARASAVRTEKSKMRYALQHYAHARVALVKGKRGWRIAGGSAIVMPHGDHRGIAAFARISALAGRLIQGQERHEYLFSALTEAQGALMSVRDGSALDRVDLSGVIGTIELICVARLLFALGYLSSEALETALFTHTAYTGESLLEAEGMRDALLSSINRAIAATHL